MICPFDNKPCTEDESQRCYDECEIGRKFVEDDGMSDFVYEEWKSLAFRIFGAGWLGSWIGRWIMPASPGWSLVGYIILALAASLIAYDWTKE